MTLAICPTCNNAIVNLQHATEINGQLHCSRRCFNTRNEPSRALTFSPESTVLPFVAPPAIRPARPDRSKHLQMGLARYDADGTPGRGFVFALALSGALWLVILSPAFAYRGRIWNGVAALCHQITLHGSAAHFLAGGGR